jgi:uncharacterized protein Yka (UPF0111/DUF47 family)
VRSHWFLPESPDVLGTLREQVRVTMDGMAAFAAWACGESAAESAVREAEDTANDLRRRLSQQLRSAFSTPLDQEDLYTLSERLGGVLSTARNVMREAEVLNLDPDPAVTALAEIAVEGAGHLAVAMQALDTDNEKATAAADAAIAAARRMEEPYRLAMRAGMNHPDLRALMGRRELYRRTLEVGEREAAVADRIWYAVLKDA